MDIEINFHQMHSSDQLKQYCTEKLNKLSKYYSRVESIRIVMEVAKLDHKISSIVHLPQKVTLRADAVSKDMYASIDMLMNKLERQLTDYKEQH